MAFQNRLSKNLKMIFSMAKRVPVIPIFVLIAAFTFAIFAPWIAPFQPRLGNLSERLVPPFWMEGGNSLHLLGTDYLGRDILSRVIYGARVSLTVALLAVFSAGTMGTIIGLVSGYYGGFVDILLMRFADITLSIPMMLLAIILVAKYQRAGFCCLSASCRLL